MGLEIAPSPVVAGEAVLIIVAHPYDVLVACKAWGVPNLGLLESVLCCFRNLWKEDNPLSGGVPKDFSLRGFQTLRQGALRWVSEVPGS